MSPNLTLLVVVAALYAAGIYLLLDRHLVRVVLGMLLVSNATNVLVLSGGGPAGAPPIADETTAEQMSDSLVQALILTAIVITLGVAVFLLAMVLRVHQLDSAPDDVDLEQDPVAATQRAGQLGLDDDEFALPPEPGRQAP